MEIAGTLTNVLQQYQSSLSVAASRSAGSSAVDAVRQANGQTVDFGSPYVVDLSRAAQEVLAQQNSGKSFGLAGPLTLSEGQVRRLESVLSQYQEAPLNDETSAALYTDLKAAGLLPSQLASTREAALFDSGQSLLDLLGGDSARSGSGTVSLFSSLLGDDSSLSFESSSKLVSTLLRYGEISGESRGVLLDAKISSYLDLFDQGGIVA